MTPLPGAVQSTGLILATVLAAAGLNLGVMSLGQADGDGTDVDTAAAPTSTDAGLQALYDTAPAAVDPGAVTTVAPTDPTVPDPARSGSTLPAGTGVTPGPPVASGTGSTGAPSAPGTATVTASTVAATTATSQQTSVTSRPSSSQAAPSTPPPGPTTTAQPTTTAATARPTTSTTRAPQTANYDHTVTGAGALTVSVTDASRLGLVTVSDNSGWSHTVDTNRPDLVKVVFTRRGSEIAVSVTLRNGVPNFTEERSDDD